MGGGGLGATDDTSCMDVVANHHLQMELEEGTLFQAQLPSAQQLAPFLSGKIKNYNVNDILE